MIKRVKYIDISNSNEALDALAFEVYTVLSGSNS